MEGALSSIHSISRVLLATALVAASSWGCSHRGPDTKALLRKYPTIIYSLTGEPLNGGPLGQPTCEEAQTAWLKRVDLDGDGTIDLPEMLAAARTQFFAMDLNHDGVITADELTIYRDPYQPQSSPTVAGRPGDGGNNKQQGNGTYHIPLRPLSSQPDPVLSADVNLDFKVTLDEFLAYEQQTFTQYDTHHRGRLEAADLFTICRTREKAANPNSSGW